MYNPITAMINAYCRITKREEAQEVKLSQERADRRKRLGNSLLETRALLQDNAPRIHLAIE